MSTPTALTDTPWLFYKEAYTKYIFPLNLLLRVILICCSHSPIVSLTFQIVDIFILMGMAWHSKFKDYGPLTGTIFHQGHNFLASHMNAYLLGTEKNNDLIFASFFIYLFGYMGAISLKTLSMTAIMPIFFVNACLAPLIWCNMSVLHIFGHMLPLLTTFSVMNLYRVAVVQLNGEKLEEIKQNAVIQAKAEVFRMASHELRNPLQAMTYSIEYLSDLGLEDHVGKSIQELKTTTQLLKDLVESVLDEKVQEMKIKLNRKRDFSILDTVEGVTDIYVRAVNKKGLKLHCFVDPDIPRLVTADPVHLTQIMSNFCSNAIKFTKFGFIELRANLVSSAPLVVRLSCKDTGIGVDVENRDKIFNLQNTSPSDRTDFGGYGLGLKICANLVRELKGEIVYTPLEKGSLFWADIPLSAKSLDSISEIFRVKRLEPVVLGLGDGEHTKIVQDYLKSFDISTILSTEPDIKYTIDTIVLSDEELLLDLPEPPPRVMICKSPVKLSKLHQCVRTKGNSEESVTPTPSSFKILVVEDEKLINKLLCKILTTAGMATRSAFNGLEGLNMIEKNSDLPDVIVLDNQMPIMTGTELVYLIRRHSNPHISCMPIIMVSGNLSSECRKDLSGMSVEVLQKPVSPNQLIQLIKRMSTDDIFKQGAH